MTRIAFLLGLLVCQFTSFAQVGIGTTTPNAKSILDLTTHTGGLLIPRMTYAERNSLMLTSDDIGMMVFQTDIPANPLPPKGLYSFDGSAWTAPLLNGNLNGQTLRWDGSKWLASSNLFNQGSSIGIGTLAPNAQLQIHSNSSPTTRLQLTSGTGNGLINDGLILGVTLANNDAHIIQQENKSLWFGTNSIERLCIDSAGNVGINKTNPSAILDVNGNVKVNSLDVNGAANVASLNANGPVKLGVSGTLISGIIRYSAMIDIPPMNSNTETIYNVSISDVMPNATVQVSPGDALTQIMISYARVSAPGNVEIKFMSMNTAIDPAAMMFYITVIQ